MEQADYLHMVHLAEQDAREDPAAYRRAVWRWALLGYAFVFVLLVCGLGLLGFGVERMLHARFQGWMLFLGLAGAAMVLSGLAALRLRIQPPEGLHITADDAPALFRGLEKIRARVKGPVLHSVVLSEAMNASISQVPRWGLLGGQRNHLEIGLPLAMALDERRLFSVLAHEYGHLRGDHGRMSAWIYRTHHAWAVLAHRTQDNETLLDWLTQGFLRWYFPRFLAKSFAMARQDEYEADATASRVVGEEAVGAALIEIDVKAQWIDQRFWRDFWAGAARADRPAELPFAQMRSRLPTAPAAGFAADALRAALKRLSTHDDTHPVLRDRLEALGHKPALPAWSARGAFNVLGAAGPRAVEEFDRRWWTRAQASWRAAHAQAQEDASRCADIECRLPQASADELVELAEARRRLDPEADVRPVLEQALSRSPAHTRALAALAERLVEAKSSAAFEHLETLHRSAEHAYAASRMALALGDVIEMPGDSRRRWRERLAQAEEREQRAWREFIDLDPLQSAAPHGLNDGELRRLRHVLIARREVRRAWVGRVSVPEMPGRPYFIVFMEAVAVGPAGLVEMGQDLFERLPLPGPRNVSWTDAQFSADKVERAFGAAVYRRTGV